MIRLVAAELRKAWTLPGVQVGAGITVLASAGVAAMNVSGVKKALASGRPEEVGYTSAVDAALASSLICTVGAVVIGVLVITSEYAVANAESGGGRQIETTLTTTSHRVAVLAAKAVTVVLTVAVTTGIAVLANLALAHHMLEQPVGAQAIQRGLGAVLYVVLMGVIAFSIGTLTRDGMVPLVILILNSSVVSFSWQLARRWPGAYWLPDLAGVRLYAAPVDLAETMPQALPAGMGAMVMLAWSFGLLTVAGIAFARREA